MNQEINNISLKGYILARLPYYENSVKIAAAKYMILCKFIKIAESKNLDILPNITLKFDENYLDFVSDDIFMKDISNITDNILSIDIVDMSIKIDLVKLKKLAVDKNRKDIINLLEIYCP